MVLYGAIAFEKQRPCRYNILYRPSIHSTKKKTIHVLVIWSATIKYIFYTTVFIITEYIIIGFDNSTRATINDTCPDVSYYVLA